MKGTVLFPHPNPRKDPLPRRLKILLTEGSSLSARQTLYALGGRTIIDVCDPKPFLCLARYSRFVRTCHRCPPFAVDPVGYMDFLVKLLKKEHYDILFPTHDQVYLVSKFRLTFAPLAALAVPDFPALERVQSKSAFADLLQALNLPRPETAKVKDPKKLTGCPTPCYVKLPFSTGGAGVWHVENRRSLEALTNRLEANGYLNGSGEILVQQPAPGTLCVAQSVFQNGRLLAAHTYQARAQGVGGSAYARVSVSHPVVLDHLRTLGEHLHWHGALMLDYLFDPATGPVYIEANPRIGETVNALESGLNLCELLLQVALDRPTKPSGQPKPGARTHSILMGLLALAQRSGKRRLVLAELCRALAGRGIYTGSLDELTRLRHDFPSLIPAVFLAAQLLVNPGSARTIVSGAVKNYGLTETTLKRLDD
jgi:predicted ATP-grasp superfamily ATP-dependent carboligase